jgi:magnesium-protoporphyrin IX monomethyl ester (oxidative) cyclase
VINRKDLGLAALAKATRVVAGHLVHGQTNFARMLWKFRRTYNADRQVADHRRPIRYELPVPDWHTVALRDRKPARRALGVPARLRAGRPRAQHQLAGVARLDARIEPGCGGHTAATTPSPWSCAGDRDRRRVCRAGPG